MALGPIAKYVAPAAAGALLTVGLSSLGSGESSFRDQLETQLKGAATTGNFSTDGMRVETLTAPSKDTLDAAEYNLAENLGAKNPNKPDKHTAADVFCAIGAASFSKEVMAGPLDKLRDADYDAAAQACGSILLTNVDKSSVMFTVPLDM